MNGKHNWIMISGLIRRCKRCKHQQTLSDTFGTWGPRRACYVPGRQQLTRAMRLVLEAIAKGKRPFAFFRTRAGGHTVLRGMERRQLVRHVGGGWSGWRLTDQGWAEYAHAREQELAAAAAPIEKGAQCAS